MPNIFLDRFMIFNPNDGLNEGQERDKLLYHWTKEAVDNKLDLVEQIDDICLCDATITASLRLNSKPPQADTDESIGDLFDQLSCSDRNPSASGRSFVITFVETLIIIVEVEPKQSIWMAVHVKFESPVSQQDGGGDTPITEGTTANSNSNHPVHRIDCDSVPVAGVKKVVLNMYARFCLLNGTFQMIADEALKGQQHTGTSTTDCDSKSRLVVRDKIRQLCDTYFNTTLAEIHLCSIISNVATLYNYIFYLDLNAITLMKVNSFINHLICIDATRIRHTIAIFNDQLLWSSLCMIDTRLLYNYLVSVLIKDALQEELRKEVDKVRRVTEDKLIFLLDNKNEEGNIEETIYDKGKSVDCQNGTELTKFYMTVFRSSNNMTLGLILSSPMESDLIQKCDQFLTSDSRLGVIPLASLAQTVGQNFLKTSSMSSSANASGLNQQPNASTSGITSFSRRRQSAGSSSAQSRNSISNDLKYLCLDRLNISINFSPNMDTPIKEQQGASTDVLALNKKLRLIKYLLELDPEFREIKQLKGSHVEEFFGKTTSDIWLNITQSQYKSIYSIYKMRNAGLSEAQQSAINLETFLSSNKFH